MEDVTRGWCVWEPYGKFSFIWCIPNFFLFSTQKKNIICMQENCCYKVFFIHAIDKKYIFS